MKISELNREVFSSNREIARKGKSGKSGKLPTKSGDLTDLKMPFCSLGLAGTVEMTSQCQSKTKFILDVNNYQQVTGITA